MADYREPDGVSVEGEAGAARELMDRSKRLHMLLTLANVALIIVGAIVVYVIAREVQLASYGVHSPWLTACGASLPTALGVLVVGRWSTRRIVRARMRSISREVAARHGVPHDSLEDTIAALS